MWIFWRVMKNWMRKGELFFILFNFFFWDLQSTARN